MLPRRGDGSSTSLDVEGVVGKMLEQSTVGSTYLYDYVITQKYQPERHLRTVFSVETEEGRGKWLVTMTAQCLQSDYAAAKPLLEAIVKSFKAA